MNSVYTFSARFGTAKVTVRLDFDKFREGLGDVQYVFFEWEGTVTKRVVREYYHWMKGVNRQIAKLIKTDHIYVATNAQGQQEVWLYKPDGTSKLCTNDQLVAQGPSYPTGKISGVDWLHHEERVAANNQVSLGIGTDLASTSGLAKAEIAQSIYNVFHQLIDGGVTFIMIGPTPEQQVLAYVLQRGRMVDAGMRKDFEKLGWKSLCDACDDELKRQQGEAT